MFKIADGNHDKQMYYKVIHVFVKHVDFTGLIGQ